MTSQRRGAISGQFEETQVAIGSILFDVGAFR
jgi:hypothetical protein